MEDGPIQTYDTTVAVSVEMSSGIIELMEILKRSISKVKRMPARGALKMPAMAPAAPHPKRTVIPLYERCALRPMLLPNAAPVYTIGASAPTEPPSPMVSTLVSSEDHIL